MGKPWGSATLLPKPTVGELEKIRVKGPPALVHQKNISAFNKGTVRRENHEGKL